MNYKVKLSSIKAMIFDYDGVMTDNKIYTGNNIVLRSGNVKDGYAIQYAIKLGFKIAILSGGSGESIVDRCKMLGIKDVFVSCSNKVDTFNQYLKDNNLTKDDVLYMGDDIPDYEVMRLSGLSTCPKDAAIEIKQIADYISYYNGGEGCVRDIIEQVLRCQRKWFGENSLLW